MTVDIKHKFHIFKILDEQSKFLRFSFLTVHIFSDASTDAIDAVAYLKLFDINSTCFMLGKAKIRLGLRTVVLAVELSDIIRDHLELEPINFFYYTDSRVVF